MAEKTSTTYIPIGANSVPPAYPFLDENNFTLLKASGKAEGRLRGPRRVLRLCTFAFLLPAVLITIPLYVRLVLYPPGHYPMMPTDQRLLDRHVSSVWCQAQTTQMNGSFSAYLTEGEPRTFPQRRHHTMLHHITLEDDVKEYWGFHLLEGSRITLSACSSNEGAQLMMLRGVENLRRCAWIGEEDSGEDEREEGGMKGAVAKGLGGEGRGEDGEGMSVGGREGDGAQGGDSNGNEFLDTKNIGQDNVAIQKGNEEFHINSKKTMEEDKDEATQSEELELELEEIMPEDRSHERRKDLQKLLKKAIRLSKDKKEILRILHSVGQTSSDQKELPPRIKKLIRISQDDQGIVRKTRSIPVTDFEDAREVTDDDDGKKTGEGSEEVERIVGGQIFLPEGLKLERGTFNQSTNGDASADENVSSYSSSEEALASCEGVIMALPLLAYRSCSQRWTSINKFSYDIPVTGTYYFVFSSENEIKANHLYFNITFERVVYDTSHYRLACANETSCVLPLGFLSDAHTVVEVAEESSWDNAYVLSTHCEPRVPLYLTFLLLVPLLILCAFH